METREQVWSCLLDTANFRLKYPRKRIPPRRKRWVYIFEQTVSEDLEEEHIFVVTSSIFYVNQYLGYENDKQQPLFDHDFDVRYTVGFVFSNRYYSTEKHTWGGKGGIILKIQNDINIPNGNNSSVIRGIMKEVLLEKTDGVKFGLDMKGRSKTGSKSIVDIDSQEAQKNCWCGGVGDDCADYLIACQKSQGSQVSSIVMNLFSWNLYC